MATKRLKWTSTDNSRNSSRDDSGRETPEAIVCPTPTVNWDYELFLDNEPDSSVDESESGSMSDSDFYIKSKCSAVEIFDQIMDEECAVNLCNRNFRNQYDNLKFIGFPINNPLLCKIWWELCGHSDECDLLSKICVIHFEPEDIVNILVKQDNQLFYQTMLKDIYTIPSRFLKPCDFLKSSMKLSPMSMETSSDCSAQVVIPKLMNNGNDSDYIYLDTLDDDNIGDFLASGKKCTSNSSKNNFSELVEININEGTPKSILSNEDLTLCYGCMGPAKCEESCERMCYYAIPDFQRSYIYQKFQMLESMIEQNCKIAEQIHVRYIRRKSDTFESEQSYYLIVKNKSIEVCRLFFMNTLGIPECRLNAILTPVHYSWFYDRENALKSEQPEQENKISESMNMTDFTTNSLNSLKKDYNLYESESDSDVSLDNVSTKEYENVFLYLKSIPRVLSTYQENSINQSFETSISLNYIYKSYSENYIQNKIPPPYTMRQFKRIYNQYMKSLMIHV